MNLFKQTTLIGIGLIGSSILRRLKKNGEIKKLITYDNNKSVSEIIEKEGLSDQVVHSPIDAVKNSDLVLISTPLSSFESIVNLIKDNLKPGSILTEPEFGSKSPDKIFKKVDFPAPFGPIKPVIFPCLISKLTPSTAAIPPKCLTTSFTKIMININIIGMMSENKIRR